MITDAGQRVTFLIDIAETLLREGDHHTPRSLITEAMRLSEGGAWSQVAGKVGQFMPEVVQAAGTEVIGLVQRRHCP